jgi:hypothetical protein
MCAGQIRLGVVDVSQPVQTPGNDTHQGDVVLQAFGGLQQAFFDTAAGFDDLVEDFDLPAAAVPANHGDSFVKIGDRCVRQQHPLDGFVIAQFSQLPGEFSSRTRMAWSVTTGSFFCSGRQGGRSLTVQ